MQTAVELGPSNALCLPLRSVLRQNLETVGHPLDKGLCRHYGAGARHRSDNQAARRPSQ
jgi:hypothetical protein